MAESTWSGAFGSLFESRSSTDKLEQKLRKWAQPPGEVETEKCDRAVRMIKAAIDADEKLSKMDISVFAKGSYANRTNIPSDSDVDVAVRLNSLYYNIYPEGSTAQTFGFVTATYIYEHFKAEVATAIVNYFGSAQVTIGNKAIQVHANTVRVDADVVPHAIHRHYRADFSYHEGVALKTTDGQVIYNWPKQDYDNGVKKNEVTGKRYKAITRIFKNIRCEMKEQGFRSADSAASYLLACLAYNIPNYIYDDESYVKMTEDCLIFLKQQTTDLNNVANWSEVNELKNLFGSHQGWKFDVVHAFICDAYEYFKGLK